MAFTWGNDDPAVDQATNRKHRHGNRVEHGCRAGHGKNILGGRYTEPLSIAEGYHLIQRQAHAALFRLYALDVIFAALAYSTWGFGDGLATGPSISPMTCPTGTIFVRPGAKIAFASQRPYLPQGTLKATLTYPADPSDYPDEAVLRARWSFPT